MACKSLCNTQQSTLKEEKGIDKSSHSPNTVCVHRDLQESCATLAKQLAMTTYRHSDFKI